MTPALRAVMVGAAGAGVLAGDDVRRGQAEHPVCGDVLHVTCRIAEGRVVELAWQAEGCPATMAVPAVAVAALRGRPVADAEGLLRGRLTALGGLTPAEGHALRLFLRAFAEATA